MNPNKKYKISRAIEKSIAMVLNDEKYFEWHRGYSPGFSYHAYSVFLNEFGNPKNISFSSFLKYSHSFGYGNWKVENWDNLKDIKKMSEYKIKKFKIGE